MRLRKTEQTIFLLLTLIIIVGVFSFRAYASESNGSDLEVVTAWAYLDGTRSPLIVNASWLDDEMLRIDVLDERSGANTSFAIRLSDYTDSKLKHIHNPRPPGDTNESIMRERIE